MSVLLGHQETIFAARLLLSALLVVGAFTIAINT